MTIKLYENSAYDTTFTATVVEVRQEKNGYGVILDRTLFFPTGGGQEHDGGTLAGLPILDVRIDREGVITHVLPAPLPVGETVSGEIDFALRFRRMQNHTGEHILSGIAHRLYGFGNVGFHLGEGAVTVDFDGVPPADDYTLWERLANEAVYQNLPVNILYPTEEEISSLEYRSKIEIEGQVRIVEIEGVDRCACCAPHVTRTGEVGIIKILSAMHYKGGCRLTILCGTDAVLDYQSRIAEAQGVSRLLSVPENAIAEGVMALLAEAQRLRVRLAERREEIVRLRLESVTPSDGNILFYSEDSDAHLLQDLAVRGAEKTKSVAVAFAPDGKGGFLYAIASEHIALRTAVKEYNRVLSGRGGGNDAVVRGTFFVSREEIERYFS